VHDVFRQQRRHRALCRARTRDLVFDSRITLEHTPLPAFAGYDGDVEAYSATMRSPIAPKTCPISARSIERLHPDSRDRRALGAQLRARRWAYVLASPADRDDGRRSALISDYATRLRAGAQRRCKTLELRTGTCRDFAMLMIEAARSLGLAAQFVSGYIRTFQSRRTRWRAHARVGARLSSGLRWVEFDRPTALSHADLVARRHSA